MPRKSTTKVDKDSKTTSSAAKKPSGSKAAKKDTAAKTQTTTKKTAARKTSVAKQTAAEKPARKKTTTVSAEKVKTTKPKKTKLNNKEDKAVSESVTLVEGSPVENLSAKPIVYGDIAIEPYPINPAEEYMNNKQKDHFIEILLAWKKALMEEVDRTMHLLQGEVKNLPDMTDRASQDEEFSVALRTRDRERKLIKKIDQTLTRIRKDDYGFCDSCGVEIGIRRLEARPTANLCIDCKTLDEIVEKQTRG